MQVAVKAVLARVQISNTICFPIFTTKRRKQSRAEEEGVYKRLRQTRQQRIEKIKDFVLGGCGKVTKSHYWKDKLRVLCIDLVSISYMLCRREEKQSSS